MKQTDAVRIFPHAGLHMLVLAIMGREIIGTRLVDVLDDYHFMGIANLVCLGLAMNAKSFKAFRECKVISWLAMNAKSFRGGNVGCEAGSWEIFGVTLKN